MSKTIITRIKNKVDNLSTWVNSTNTLLDGEIAIVRVPTGQTYVNPVTEKAEPVVELLMKVGDGKTAFADLPWLSAKASDVYNWAKTASAEAVPFTMTDGESTTSGKTLRELLELINDRALANSATIASKVDVEKVSTAISSAISAFEAGLVHTGTQGTNEIVKAITQADGKVTVTYGSITLDELPAVDTTRIQDNAVTTAKIADGNVTDAKIDSVSASKVSYTDTNKPNIKTLPDKIADVEEQIAGINKAIAGGVHFIGTTTTDITTETNKVSKNVTINEKSVEAIQGDIVIYGTREFIWTGSAWEELGDVTRIGNLEKKLDDLDVTTTNTVETTHKFVSQVTQEDGKINVTYTQPTSADVSHNSTTVKDTLESHTMAIDILNGAYTVDGSVAKTVKDAIDALDYTSPNTAETDTTIEFIDTVSQENGQISATKKKITAASTTTPGIVQLNDTTSSTSTSEAATANAVKVAYDAGADAQGRVGDIEANYVRVDKVNDKDTLVWAQSGTVEEIIFDCGGAAS